MKPELQAKFLQHLNKKKKDGGFTLIELLVVIIIIGILAAIALPSLLAQSNKARQSEARNNTGTLNRAQQAYFLEKQGFTESFADLGVGIASQSANYLYTAKSSGSGATAIVATISTPVTSGVLKAYAGVVYVTTIKQTGSSDQAATQAKACEGKDPSIAAITAAPSSPFDGCSSSLTGYIELGN